MPSTSSATRPSATESSPRQSLQRASLVSIARCTESQMDHRRGSDARTTAEKECRHSNAVSPAQREDRRLASTVRSNTQGSSVYLHGNEQGREKKTGSHVSLRKGDVVRCFSFTEDAWVKAKVVDLVDGCKIRVEYQAKDSWCAKTLSINSERLESGDRVCDGRPEDDEASDEDSVTDDSLPRERDPETWDVIKRPKRKPGELPVERPVDPRPPPQDPLARFVREKVAATQARQQELIELDGAQTYTARIHENNPMSTTNYGPQD